MAISSRFWRSNTRGGGVTGGYDVIVWFIEPHMAGLYKSSLDIEGIDLVKHGFYQTFDSIFGRAIRSKSRNTKGPGR